MQSRINVSLEKLADKVIQLDSKMRSNMASGLPISGYDQFVSQLFKPMKTSHDMVHHACTGMVGEAAELLDTSKKAWVYGSDYDLENIIEEMGDLRFYYQSMLNLLRMTDEHIITHNIFKLRQRYPDLVYKDEDAIDRADKEKRND